MEGSHVCVWFAVIVGDGLAVAVVRPFTSIILKYSLTPKRTTAKHSCPLDYPLVITYQMA